MLSPTSSCRASSAHPSAEAALASRALNILSLTLAPLLIAPAIHNGLQGRNLAAGLILGEEVFLLVSWLLNRAGQTRSAAAVFVSSTWLLTAALTFAGEGSHDVAVLAFPAVLLAAGLVLGPRFLWTLTSLTLAALCTLWLGEIHGWIVNANSTRTGYGTLIDTAVILVITAATTAVLTGNFRRALRREHDNAGELARSRADLEQHAAALEQSELRFRTAIELAADGILMTDREGRVTVANSRVCSLLGRTRHAVIGCSIFDLLEINSGDCGDSARDRLDRGDAVTAERTLKRADGSEWIVETTWQRLPDRTLQCFVRDISARRRLEEHLRHAQKMEAVGALAGGIAHDFNNLLTVMQGFFELIHDDPTLSPALAENIRELQTAATHAADLTHQLLAFAGRRPLKRKTTDVHDILTTHQRLMQRLMGDNIAISIVGLEKPCPIHVDTGMIAQVLVNLAANARDAMPQGGRFALTAIEPALRQPPIDSGITRDQAHYTGFRARDTGSGIPPEMIRRIFEPFFTTKEQGKGTGLGLAMVQGIVERHGGWIEITSAPGEGTEFSIYLPLHSVSGGATEPVQAALAPVPSSADDAARGTILVVDDDPGVRRLALSSLADSGYEVIEAASGPEALKAWGDRGGVIDLLFTDMVMPGGMNGLQLIEACRDRQPGLAAVLTSGYVVAHVEPDREMPGDVVFLPKPYVNQNLLETLRSALPARG